MIIKTAKSTDLSQNLSSNALFHFTNSLDRLKEILKNGFRLFYAPEILPKKTPEGKFWYYVAPMVCFCDIPLGGVKVHLQRYGNYGLGVHKNFCLNVNINPVFYIYGNRALNSIFPESIHSFTSIIPYIKQYSGKTVKRKGNFRFYNEREWRYVKSKELKMLQGNEDEILKKCYDLNKNPVRTLVVNHENIEYIIVENKSEILAMVEFIDANIGVTEKEKRLLSTKIISANRIKYDF